jgi:4-amino-4-deoxy-L-arabinose transferase-like glycosyltransferase
VSARSKVLLLALLVFVPFLGSRDFWAPDEPRYAQVGQEMVQNGHWWHPHVNGREYRDKPPLYFWAEAVISLPLGRVNHWTARIPSVACGLLVVFLLFDLGRRLPLPDGNPELAGTAAALAFATCWLGPWMTRRVNLDVPLAAMATAAAWAAWRAHEAAREGRSSWRWAALAGASTALGVMLKGPVVLLPVVGGTLALMAHAGFRGERGRGHLLKGWFAGLGGFVAVLVAWLLPAATIGGYDVLGIFGEHVVERASKGMHHVRPAWYYLKSLPLDFLPWTLLAVPAAWSLVKKGAKRSAADWLVIGWLLLPFLVLSIVVEKRNVYLLPALPAVALLVGRWLARLPAEAPNPKSLRACGWIGAGLLGLICLLMTVAAAGWTRIEALEEVAGLDGLRLAAAGVAVAALGAVLIVIAGVIKRQGPAPAVWAFALAFGAVELAVFAALPLLDPVKSPREAGQAIAELTGEEPLACWPLFRTGYNYYSGRTLAELIEREELEDWLAAQPEPAWVLTFERHLEEAPLDGSSPPEVAWKGPVGHRTAVLLKYSR